MTTNKKFFLSLVSCCLLFLPFAASAANVSLFPTGYWGPLVSCIGTACTTCDLFSTAQMIIYFIMTLTLFVVAPFMIMWGGLMMLIAGGNEERFSSGRKIATGAVWGIVIALGAFLIVNTLLVTVAKNFSGFSRSGFTISCTAKSPYVPPSGPANYFDF